MKSALKCHSNRCTFKSKCIAFWLIQKLSFIKLFRFTALIPLKKLHSHSDNYLKLVETFHMKIKSTELCAQTILQWFEKFWSMIKNKLHTPKEISACFEYMKLTKYLVCQTLFQLPQYFRTCNTFILLFGCEVVVEWRRCYMSSSFAHIYIKTKHLNLDRIDVIMPGNAFEKGKQAKIFIFFGTCSR